MKKFMAWVALGLIVVFSAVVWVIFNWRVWVVITGVVVLIFGLHYFGVLTL